MAKSNSYEGLEEVEKEVDRTSAQIWKLTDRELEEIISSLKELIS